MPVLDEDEDIDDDDIISEVQQPEGKIGVKKMRKLQEKAEKKAMREVSCACDNNIVLLNFTY